MSSSFDFIGETVKNKLVGAVNTVMQLPILAKATSNDDEPTPGYIFDEIASTVNPSHSPLLNLPTSSFVHEEE